MPAGRHVHVDSRLPQLLDAAARRFCQQGYGGATMREIAADVGMQPGSLYSHFDTKEALLVAVYVRGVDQICEAVQGALAPHSEPWSRLEAACVAHLEAVLRDDDFARVVVRVKPDDVPLARESLIAQRDRYETIWHALVAALPLGRRTDRRALRLLLLGGMNGAQHWYRADGALTPRNLARQFVALLRQPHEVPA